MEKSYKQEEAMTHAEKAKKLFEEGYNCAQAVTLAFAEEMGMEKEEAARISSSFGGGLGRLREVCGCVSGMALVAGKLWGYESPVPMRKRRPTISSYRSWREPFRRRMGVLYAGSFWLASPTIQSLFRRPGRPNIIKSGPVPSLLPVRRGFWKNG